MPRKMARSGCQTRFSGWPSADQAVHTLYLSCGKGRKSASTRSSFGSHPGNRGSKPAEGGLTHVFCAAECKDVPSYLLLNAVEILGLSANGRGNVDVTIC